MTRSIVSYYARPASFATGGVNSSQQDWMAHLARSGNDVTVVHAAGGFTRHLADDRLVRFREVPHVGRRRVTMFAPRIGRHLRDASLLYLHEGWTLSNLWAAFHARRLRIPYAVMPHGVYERPIARLQRRFPFRRWAERRLLEGAAFVHVFFAGEQDEVHALAPAARCLVAPTGFTEKADGDAVDSARERQDYLAWVGRFDIHHKGLDILVDALGRVPAEERPVIRMIGPDHLGDKRRFAELVRDRGLDRWISIEDPRSKDGVEQFVRGSRAFIHTPRWECLGRTVVDAMLTGTPVLLTETAQISAPIGAAHAATIIPLDPADLAAALAAISDVDSTELGATGRRWATQYFDWDRVLEIWSERIESQSEVA